MKNKITALLIALSAGPNCYSAPTLINTPTAQIVVADPEHIFYENISFGKNSLADFEKKKFSYYYIDGAGKHLTGHKLLFGGMDDTPIVNAVTPILEKQGVRLVNADHAAYFGAPFSIPADQASDFIQGQAQLFRLTVENQGNPDDLVSKSSKRRLLGNAAALASMLVGVSKLGASTGSQMTLGSGLSESIFAAVSKNRAAVVATDLTNAAIDFSAVTTVQARTIKSGGGNTGQVLIFYKVPLTSEAENAAMVEAIVALAGADRTPEQIAQARQADFDNKKLIWQTCVQQGRCTAQ